MREPGTVGVLSENFSKVPGLVCYGAALVKNFCSFWCVHFAVQEGVLQCFVVRLLPVLVHWTNLQWWGLKAPPFS